jgi:putative ABC transport system permease protein
MNVAAVLAIAISILGLFSLVLIFVKEKTKEIGIRKVMGANVSEIINMIGYHFLKRMLIAFCIAVPLSYFAMHKWLENFAYKIELSWWLFASGGLIVFMLAFMTIAIQAYKSARVNPIDSLRWE